jgi:hypothetical protein
MLLLEVSDWRHLAYHLGGDLVRAVIRKGEVVRSAEPALR